MTAKEKHKEERRALRTMAHEATRRGAAYAEADRADQWKSPPPCDLHDRASCDVRVTLWPVDPATRKPYPPGAEIPAGVAVALMQIVDGRAGPLLLLPGQRIVGLATFTHDAAAGWAFTARSVRLGLCPIASMSYGDVSFAMFEGGTNAGQRFAAECGGVILEPMEFHAWAVNHDGEAAPMLGGVTVELYDARCALEDMRPNNAITLWPEKPTPKFVEDTISGVQYGDTSFGLFEQDVVPKSRPITGKYERYEFLELAPLFGRDTFYPVADLTAAPAASKPKKPRPVDWNALRPRESGILESLGNDLDRRLEGWAAPAPAKLDPYTEHRAREEARREGERAPHPEPARKHRADARASTRPTGPTGADPAERARAARRAFPRREQTIPEAYGAAPKPDPRMGARPMMGGISIPSWDERPKYRPYVFAEGQRFFGLLTMALDP